MKMLKDNAAVKKICCLLEENERKEQTAEYTRLIAALDNIKQQYNALSEKIWDTKYQLADLPEQRNPAQDSAFHAAMIAGSHADLLHYRLFTIQEQMISLFVSSVPKFKRTGISILDESLSDLGVQDILENIQEDSKKVKSEIAECIQKANAGIHEVQNTDKHLKTALDHLSTFPQIFSCIGEKAGFALSASRRLETLSKEKSRQSEKSSIQGRLKAEISICHIPAKTQKFHGEER